MNCKVCVLTIATFMVGLVELIIGTMLPIIADDLIVTIGASGQLITVLH